MRSATVRPYVEIVEPVGRVGGAVLLLHGGKSAGLMEPKRRRAARHRHPPRALPQGAVERLGGGCGAGRRFGAAPPPGPVWRHTGSPGRPLDGWASRGPGGHCARGRRRRRAGSVAASAGPRNQEPRVDGRLSAAWAVRAKQRYPAVARFEVDGDGHAMLRRARVWHTFACHAVLGGLGVEPLWPLITRAPPAAPPRHPDSGVGFGPTSQRALTLRQ